MTKRPKYANNIGVFRGARGETAWIKIHLPQGATYKGKSYPPGGSLEIKLGRLSSWDWALLEAKRDEIQGKADRSEPLEENPIPDFATWADDWLERAKERLRGYATVKIHVERQWLPLFGSVQLSTIQTHQINTWIGKRLKQAKPATVKRELATLNVILNDAVKTGYIKSNPGQHADTIRGVVGRQRFLSGEEMLDLLASAEECAEWLPDFILWAIHSGMRKGEILALIWPDVRPLPDGRVIIQVRTSKSGQPRMVVATTTMKDILQRQEERRKDGDERIFTMSKMTLRRRWEDARKKAGLEDVTIHDLRRTHSTYAVASGVDLRTLAGRIGHADLSMLQKHYAALVGDAEAEAAERIQGVFDKMAAASLTAVDE
jgi:integrase